MHHIRFLFTLALGLRCTATFGEHASAPKAFSLMVGSYYGPTYGVELNADALRYTIYKGWNYTSFKSGNPRPIASAMVTPTPLEWRDFRQSLDNLNI